MRTREEAHVDRDGAHFVRLAAVDAEAGVEHLRAQRVVFDVAEHGADVAVLLHGKLGLELRLRRFLDGLDGLDARVLVLLVDRREDRVLRLGVHEIDDVLRHRGLLPLHLVGAALGEQFLLHRDEFLDAALRDAERLDDFFFLDLDGAALDHHDRILRTGDDEVHVGDLDRLDRGVEHPVRRSVLTRHAADTNAGDRSSERDARDVQRERRRDEREDVGLVLLVGGDDVNEDLDFVLEALGEERADRAVDDAAREDLLVARASFTLDEAARDLAGGVGLLFVLDGQREERERRFLVADGDGGEDHRVAELHEAGSGGLLGHAARLDDQWTAGERALDAMHHTWNCLRRNTKRAGRIVRPRES